MCGSSTVGVRRSVACFVGTLLVLFFGSPVSSALALQPFPAEFKTQTISTNGAKIYVRVGGKGPAVVLLHGYGETGDMWAPLAAQLVRDHTVIVPDLRGMGLSGRPPSGYDKIKRRKATTLPACLMH
jgi:alpha/beta hydrolase fold